MLFCPKCGSIMKPAEIKGKKVMACSCGYSDDDCKSAKLVESSGRCKEIPVVDSDEELDTLPTTKAQCPKCGNETCYYWLVQTRAADEPETKFLKCTKCKHTFRDYG